MKKFILFTALLILAGMQEIWAQTVKFYKSDGQVIECEVSKIDSIVFVDDDSPQIAVVNVRSDSDDNADLLMLCNDGSYILCDGENSEGYGVFYMNMVDQEFEEGITVFLDGNGTPVMACMSNGHFIYDVVSENIFNFAYINNEGEVLYFNDIPLEYQDSPSSSKRKKSIITPYVDAWNTFFVDGHFYWDEHNKKALLPFTYKILSFAITAGNAMWGKAWGSFAITFSHEFYKSGYYRSKFFDSLFEILDGADVITSGFVLGNLIREGEFVFTPKKLGISGLAYMLNTYGDLELEKLGQYQERVSAVLNMEEWQIRVAPNPVELNADGGWFYVDISSKASWDIDVSQIDSEWCEIIKLGSQVAIHVLSNESGYDRTCSLKVFAKASSAINPVTIIIKQSGIVFDLSEEKLSFTPSGGSKGVYVSTNDKVQSWSVTSYPSWCEIDTARNSFFVNAGRNDSMEEREGIITVTAWTSGGLSVDRSITVEQAGTDEQAGSVLCPDENHPHVIDLGLPSGTKWCCCNVGATSPEGNGGYYAWGDTSEKENYPEENSITNFFDYENSYIIGDLNMDGHVDIADLYIYTYGGDNLYNFFDIRGTEYDVAYVRMGVNWCLPSEENMKELLEFCSKKWIDEDGKKGILLTASNGAQLFLPASGYKSDDLHDATLAGYYRTNKFTNNFRFDSESNFETSYNNFAQGLNVRAVQK